MYRLGEGRDSLPNHRGLLLVNLGSPSEPNAGSVRRFLNEFLGDKRVIGIPRALWIPLLYGIISPFRAPASAKKYRTVWTDQGSPLLVNTELLSHKVATLLPDMTVKMAMRYGEPSIRSQMAGMIEEGIKEIIVVPLFPQYSSTTTASVMDEVWNSLRAHRGVPHVRTIRDFADDPDYLDALAATVKRSFEQNGKPDVLVLSYHGIPSRYAAEGDDYPARCELTTAGLVERLGLDEDDYIHTYQSKFGPGEWLGPATIDTVAELGKRGGHIQIIAPAFTADCLETLEELDQLNHETFIEAGGTEFRYIPALNGNDAFAASIKKLVEAVQ